MKTLPYWQKAALGLTFFTFVCTIPFWFFDIDLWLASQFYDADGPRSFPLKYEQPWYALYQLIPILSVSVALISISLITLSYLKDKFIPLRRPAIVVFVSFLIGPGLLVNALFKEHYDRPRPQQVDILGGAAPYAPPLIYGGYDKGKSFPSGHASVGFAFIIFFFLYRRQNKKLANAFGIGSLVLGAATGMARIVGGGHFLSDVLWAFYMVTLTALLTEHFLIESRQSTPKPATPNQKKGALAFAAFFTTAMVVWLMLSIPFEKETHQRLDLDQVTDIHIINKSGKILVEDTTAEDANLYLFAEGYGFKPFLSLPIKTEKKGAVLSIEIDAKGLLSEAIITAKFELPEKLKNQIRVQLTE